MWLLFSKIQGLQNKKPFAHWMTKRSRREERDKVRRAYSPSATSSSTVNLRLFPLRTTRTVCHSLSLSFCPAYRVSGPLPKGSGKCKVRANLKSSVHGIRAVKATLVHMIPAMLKQSSPSGAHLSLRDSLLKSPVQNLNWIIMGNNK